MRRIRLVTAAMPPILSEIVRALADEEPGLEVVANVPRDADLCEVVGRFQADAVMTSAAQSDSASVERLLRRHPRLRVLTYSDDSRVGYLDRLVVQRTVLNDMSPDDLVHALLGTGLFS